MTVHAGEVARDDDRLGPGWRARYAVAAALYLTVWAVVLLTSLSERDVPAVSLAVAASVAAGMIARGWLIVPLAVTIVPIAALQTCDQSKFECDVVLEVVALVFFAPVSAGLLALGVVAGKLARRRRQRARQSQHAQ